MSPSMFSTVDGFHLGLSCSSIFCAALQHWLRFSQPFVQSREQLFHWQVLRPWCMFGGLASVSLFVIWTRSPTVMSRWVVFSHLGALALLKPAGLFSVTRWYHTGRCLLTLSGILRALK